jgi:hypothetical protein
MGRSRWVQPRSRVPFAHVPPGPDTDPTLGPPKLPSRYCRDHHARAQVRSALWTHLGRPPRACVQVILEVFSQRLSAASSVCEPPRTHTPACVLRHHACRHSHKTTLSRLLTGALGHHLPVDASPAVPSEE